MAVCKRNKPHNTFLSIEQRQCLKLEGHHRTMNTHPRVFASLSSPLSAAIEARQASEDLLKILLAVSVVLALGFRKHTLSSIDIGVDHVQLCAQIELGRIIQRYDVPLPLLFWTRFSCQSYGLSRVSD